MAEETPTRSAKFIQVTSLGDTKIVALDTEGQLWLLDRYRDKPWEKIKAPEVPVGPRPHPLKYSRG